MMRRLTPIRFMTFNIRYDSLTRDGNNNRFSVGEEPWSERRSKVADSAILWNPDLIGFQEALHNQVEDLQKYLGSQYECIGVGRNDGKKAGEYAPVFYKKDRFKVENWRTVWLSETPETPGSIGWDAKQPRIVTSVRLNDILTNKTIYFMNTHFDDQGIRARTNSATLILNMVNDLLSQDPDSLAVVVGDFNSPEHEEAYQIITGGKYNGRDANSTNPSQTAYVSSSDKDNNALLDSRYELRNSGIHGQLSAPFGHFHTFTGFNDHIQQQRIDYILFRGGGNVKVLKSAVLENRFDDWLYISDHRPVIAELS